MGDSVREDDEDEGDEEQCEEKQGSKDIRTAVLNGREWIRCRQTGRQAG